MSTSFPGTPDPAGFYNVVAATGDCYSDAAHTTDTGDVVEIQMAHNAPGVGVNGSSLIFAYRLSALCHLDGYMDSANARQFTVPLQVTWDDTAGTVTFGGVEIPGSWQANPPAQYDFLPDGTPADGPSIDYVQLTSGQASGLQIAYGSDDEAERLQLVDYHRRIDKAHKLADRATLYNQLIALLS